MMRKITEIARCLIGLRPLKDDPEDLILWKAAQVRMRRASRAFGREVDTFGQMVKGMQGPRSPRAATTPNKKAAKKRRKKNEQPVAAVSRGR